MKNSTFILIFIIIFSSGLVAQSGNSTKFLKPTNFQKRLTTNFGEKSRSYYSLSKDEASVINLKGPGKLRILTRGRFVPSQKSHIDYTILFSIDGAKQKKISMSDVVRSKEATYMNGKLGVPSQLKDFEIELGRGNHTIEFKVLSEKIPVAARYRFTSTKAKKQKWIAFSPMRPSEPVDLISRETTINYYRFSIDIPLKVQIIGPTQLRVLTRIENHYQMKGRINYRVQVKENNMLINTYQLSSRRSEIAVYKENTDLIPGKACEFVIDVPRGKHSYEIAPLDKDKSTVLGRMLLPEKDVKLKK